MLNCLEALAFAVVVSAAGTLGLFIVAVGLVTVCSVFIKPGNPAPESDWPRDGYKR